MIEFVSALIRSPNDAEQLASTLQFPLGKRERLVESKCELMQIPLGTATIYLLVPAPDSPLAGKLRHGNRFYSLGLKVGEETVELSDQTAVSRHGELLDFHRENRAAGSVLPKWIKKLDHVLFVTDDLRRTENTLERELGIRPDFAHSYWYFPDFDVTDMTYAAENAFIEFNQPRSREGFFGQYFGLHGNSLFALAFEAVDLHMAVGHLRERGIQVGDPMPIRAVSPHTGKEQVIEYSVTLSLKATGGLRILLTNLSWL